MLSIRGNMNFKRQKTVQLVRIDSDTKMREREDKRRGERKEKKEIDACSCYVAFG